MSQQNNPFLTKLSESVDERFSIDNLNMSQVDWMTANTTLNRKPFTTDRYPFQDGPLNDMHPNLCCIKPSQVGLTEGQIRKALAFLMRNQGRSLIYTLPNEDMYKRISDVRIRPIVMHDKVFNPPAILKPIRRKDLMELGRSKLYIAPAIEGTATSIDADAVFVDEIDLSDQTMIALLNSRMQNSDLKIKQQFSTPTFPAYGVHSTYEMTDKRLYLRKCHACNHWNNPTFSRRFVHVGGLNKMIENLTDIESVHIPQIDFDDCYVKCEKCQSRLDMEDYSQCEWVATHPNITKYRGYKVTPFATHRLPPDYIINSMIEFKNKEFVRGFHNTVLGEPYSDGTMQISHDLIAAAFKDTVPTETTVGENPCWIGIDMGLICNIVVGRGTNKHNIQPIVFRTCTVKDLEKVVDELMGKYNIVGGVIDRQPFTPTSEAMMKHTNGKIVPAQYAQSTMVKTDGFGDINYVALDRTGSLDFVHTRMKKQDIKFYGYNTYKETIGIHLRDMVREEQDEKGAVWTKLTNKDHFFHTLGYMFQAPELKELVSLKLKEEKRSMLIMSSANIGQEAEEDPLSDLIGFGGGIKTVDKRVSTRVLN